MLKNMSVEVFIFIFCLVLIGLLILFYFLLLFIDRLFGSKEQNATLYLIEIRTFKKLKKLNINNKKIVKILKVLHISDIENILIEWEKDITKMDGFILNVSEKYNLKKIPQILEDSLKNK